MARSKAQLTQAKRARKQEKKDARKLAASEPTAETESGTQLESQTLET